MKFRGIKIFTGIFLLVSGGIASAQAPVVEATANNLSRIDSLTRNFYENIPSGTLIHGQYDHNWFVDRQTFESNIALLGSSVELDYNHFVAQNIAYYRNGNQDFQLRLQQRKMLYFPIYEEVLDRYGLPQEIKYLSVIESSLNPNAVSWCGATGLWQFMPVTGRLMDMRIDYWVDDRKDMIKSTEKACEYLRTSYNQFGDWLLAIASYNCGARRVQRCIDAVGGKKSFWKIKHLLPKETQNYVPKFIATVYAMNFTPMAQLGDDKSLLMARVAVDTTMHLDQVASVLGVPRTEIDQYNLKYLRHVVPNSGNYEIMLPYHLAMDLIGKIDSVHTAPATGLIPVADVQYVKVKEKTWVYHKVKKGETLSAVARKYGCTVSQVKSWNHLRSSSLKYGQRLKIQRTVWVKKMA